MRKLLFTGFKGKNNASAAVVAALPGAHCLLTNSFGGVKRDIEALPNDCECVIMFGVDKTLKDSVRLEKAAESGGVRLTSFLNLDAWKAFLEAEGLKAEISATPTHYLCNEAYFHALKKFGGKAVFIHIPTLKYTDASFIEKIKLVCR